MPNPIVTLVEKEMAALRDLRQKHPTLFPQNDRLYPVSFFGDVRRAEVVTLALNPAHTEFSEERLWPINDEATALTSLGLANRLLCYFHSQTPRHNFFDECERALLAIGCSYTTNAAHIDVHPFPTEFAAILRNAGGAETLARIIREQSTEHLNSVLQLCSRLKLVIVIDFAVQLAEGEWMITFEYVKRKLTGLCGLLDGDGPRPPLFRGGGRAEIANRLVEHQGVLQDYLRTTPRLIFSP